MINAVVDYGYFGSAVLADDTCGSVTLSNRAGEVFSVNVEHDPELTMSGLYEPCSASEKW